MILEIRTADPDLRTIKQCVDLLRKGEVIVCPTDTVYAFVCSSEKHKGIERLAQLKGKRMNKVELSLICSDLSHLSRYARQVSTPAFRIMKQALPGPYTFIVNASAEIPNLFKNNRRTVGIRVPNDAVVLAILQELGHALAVTSVHDPLDESRHLSDPYEIHEAYGKMIGAVIDAGARGLEGSTVIDLSSGDPELLREGKGSLEGIL